MNNEKIVSFLSKHRSWLVALAAGVLIPAAMVQAQSALNSLSGGSSQGTVINCMVQGSCSILVTSGNPSMLEGQSKEMKFGSGVETATFGGSLTAAGLISSGSATATSFIGVGGVTTTIANSNGSIALFSNIGTVTSSWASATGTCLSFVSVTGTRTYATWNGGALVNSTTNCQ